MQIKCYTSVFCNSEGNFEKKNQNQQTNQQTQKTLSPLWIQDLKNYLFVTSGKFLHSAHFGPHSLQ